MRAFESVACNKNNTNWERLIERRDDLYERKGDQRTPFQRDYTRILHSKAIDA